MKRRKTWTRARERKRCLKEKRQGKSKGVRQKRWMKCGSVGGGKRGTRGDIGMGNEKETNEARESKKTKKMKMR